jgi:hypothetical protein
VINRRQQLLPVPRRRSVHDVGEAVLLTLAVARRATVTPSFSDGVGDCRLLVGDGGNPWSRSKGTTTIWCVHILHEPPSKLW